MIKHPVANVVSVSGGKDSTATLLLALERGAPNLSAVFCDTGHEHAETYRYVDYLRERLGVEIETLRADFTERIARRRAAAEDWPEPSRSRALKVLHPTGIPFLDLCLWKGRFPSPTARFCSTILKSEPIEARLLEFQEPIIVSWIGIRRDESRARANAIEFEKTMGTPESFAGSYAYRPIVDWTADEVFDLHRAHGVEPNPLYLQGMTRVGCMPCIHARKSELMEIGRRYPEEFERVAEWECLVSEASKTGLSTLFRVTDDPARRDPLVERLRHGEDKEAFAAARAEWISGLTPETHGILHHAEWAKTSRGGRQLSILAAIDAPSCSSEYGLCE